jgi:uncharacterized protein (TIGR00730 family)
MNITVFCSSKTVPDDPAYQEAMHLGRLLALANHTVLTGGYIGSMEAVSRGAAEAGGHVIGVTCDEIEAWRPIRANPWVREQRHSVTLRQRLFTLIEDCDAAMALPGGIGTLAEVAVMWSHLQTGAISRKPLVLIGPGWKTVMVTFWNTFDHHVNEKHRGLLSFVQDVDHVLEALE